MSSSLRIIPRSTLNYYFSHYYKSIQRILSKREFSMASTGNLSDRIKQLIKDTPVLVYSKTTCDYCTRAKKLLKIANVSPHVIELDKADDGPKVQQALREITKQTTVPNIFVWGEHIGGCDELLRLYSSGVLKDKLIQHTVPSFQSSEKFDFDLIVIGGGSGGLACAKEAGKMGQSVAMLDFVEPTPSPLKTTWGLGGTCVNVGCIPKKLMHRGAILGHDLKDSKLYGWKTPDSIGQDWATLVQNVQMHVKSLNFQSTKDTDRTFVNYSNAFGRLESPHNVRCISKDKSGQTTQEKVVTGKYIVIATGGRPFYPEIPGAVEYGITSDDLFSLPYAPGKTVVVGASYVALECAGFLRTAGCDVTVMVRSILLRGFDREMADMIGEYMENIDGIKFQRKAVPVKVERVAEGNPGTLKVTYETIDPNDPSKKLTQAIECNTVLFAAGRIPCTKNIGLEKAGVVADSKGYIPTVYEQTNVTNIFALGDILKDKLELTPVAIQAGRLLAKRLFMDETKQCDYINVPTTVFTPREYGAIGLAEEDAQAVYGNENIIVYHGKFLPLEDAMAKSHYFDTAGYEFEYPWCYGKLVCNSADNERVLGFHVLSPNAGEITQGYAVAIRMGATKADFDATVGIHPTCSESLTMFSISKESQIDITPGGC